MFKKSASTNVDMLYNTNSSSKWKIPTYLENSKLKLILFVIVENSNTKLVKINTWQKSNFKEIYTEDAVGFLLLILKHVNSFLNGNGFKHIFKQC